MKGVADEGRNTLACQSHCRIFLIPSSKSHLVAAREGLSHGNNLERADSPEFEDEGLKDGFDWYMSPADKNKYERIYSASSDRHGLIQCKGKKPLR